MKQGNRIIRYIFGIMAGSLLLLSPLIPYAAEAVKDKVINLVIGGRLVEITLPISEDIPKGKKIIIKYGFEEIIISLDTGTYTTSKSLGSTGKAEK